MSWQKVAFTIREHYVMDAVKISIIIPCYNSEKYIEEAVVSACSQVFDDYEVLVLDNNSTDGTGVLLNGLKEDYDFRLIQNNLNIGAIGNFNNGIHEAKGKYIKFLESDDVLEPKCLAIMDNFLTDEISFICGSKTLIDGKSNIIAYHDVQTRLVQGIDILTNFRKTGNIIGTPSDCLVAKELLLSVDCFSERYGNYLNDLDVWLKICASDNQIQFISDRVCRVRRHPAQMGAIGGDSLQDLKVALKMLDEDYFKDQRFFMEVHFGAAYLYRGVRQLSKLKKGNIFGTSKLLCTHLKFKVIFVILYMPVYLYLLLKSKRGQ